MFTRRTFCSNARSAGDRRETAPRFPSVCAAMVEGELRKSPLRLFAGSSPGHEIPIGVRGTEGISAGPLSIIRSGKERTHALSAANPRDSHFESKCHPCSSRLRPSQRTLDGKRSSLGSGAALASSWRAAGTWQRPKAIWISSSMRKGA